MKRSTVFTIMYILMIVALIIFLIWMVGWLKSESSDCVRNPVKYFTTINENIYCNCYDDKGMFIEGINEEVSEKEQINLYNPMG